MQMSENGEILKLYLDQHGTSVSGVSGLVESSGKLFMGHLSQDYVSVFTIPSR
jgi:hypothetical protein